jgi:thiol:disulfide interchange protein DsbD
MTRVQQLLAFPLYASVAWLVWVVSQQAGPPGVAAALAGLVLIAFAAWLHGLVRERAGLRRRVTSLIALALAVTAVALGAVANPGSAARTPGSAAAKADGWEPFSPARLAELRAAGTPVFVNITAAWCLTCLVNERVALRTPAVEDVFARKGVVMLKADWTRRDPVITQVLGTFGRNGVPLYLLYPAGGATREPAVLPQILSERILIDATKEVL